MRRLALLTLAAGALLCGAAQADEAFDGFRNFCVANRAASVPALAAADAAGWLPVPPQSLSQMAQMGLPGAQGRMHTVSGGAEILLTASTAVRVCAIAVAPPATSDLMGQLAAFAGVPMQTASNPAQNFYAWRDENGHHVSVDRNTPDFQAQMNSGQVFMATVQSAPQMTMILLTAAAQ